MRGRLRRRIGHRGVSLLFFALVDFIYGTILIAATPLPGSTLDALTRNWPPLPVWGVIWLTVGAICLAFAFVQQDAPGFVAAMFIKFSWCTANTLTFMENRNVWALAAVAFWAMAIGMVINTATWAETPFQMPRRVRD